MVYLGAFSANEGILRLFNSSNVETVRIPAESTAGVHTYFNAGNVGIGTSSPAAALDISQANARGAYLRSSTTGSRLHFLDSTTASVTTVGIGAEGNNLVLHGGGVEVIRVASSGDVGIGTSSPDAKLVVSEGGTTAAHGDTDLLVRHSSAAGSTAQVQILAGNTASSNLYFSDTDAYSVGGFQYNHSSNYLATRVNNSEAMRIDSSGNLLVSKTGTGIGTVGVEAKADGQLWATRDGNPVLSLNRKTSDGSIAVFYKDGSTVGSIGSSGSTGVYFGSGDTGLNFRADLDAIYPWNPSSNAARGSAVDLGFSTVPFKDLYLSGGLRGDTTFKNNAGTTEYARFDSSGNLLVATTDTLIQTATSGGGLCYAADSSLRIARESNSTGQPILDLNNTGSDDELIRLRKDGATVGSIRSQSGLVTDIILDPRSNNYATGHGIGGTQVSGVPKIIPRDGSGNALDGGVDLGHSNNRFKDLYLSGGAYLGGTGSANKLDDYEEGTFTPTLYGASSAGTTTYATVTGTYTKVGNRCTVNFVCNVTATTGTGSLRLGGLPFTSSGENTTAIMINNLNWGGGTYLMAYVGDNSDFARVYYVGDDNTWQQQQITNEAQHFIFTLSYQTA
jgi:hypothetical protein